MLIELFLIATMSAVGTKLAALHPVCYLPSADIRLNESDIPKSQIRCDISKRVQANNPNRGRRYGDGADDVLS